MSITDLRVEKISVKKMKPLPGNARTKLQPGDDAYEAIQNSVETFGYIDPIVWNERTGHVVGGNQRFNILKAKGATEISVSVISVDEDMEKMLALALNKVGGKWDQEQLQLVIKDLAGKNIDLTVTGFNAEQVRKMMEDKAEKEEPTYDLGLAPLEHHDYIFVVFDDARDWLAALAKLDIQRVRCERRHKLIGLGRVISGAKLLEKLG